MIDSNQYRLSLHISHPLVAARGISAKFTLPIRYSRSVGEKKRTPTGRDLGGIYKRTDVSLDVSGGVVSNEDVTLEDCLRGSFNGLPLEAIVDIVKTGGECFYLAGIYSQNNVLVYLPSDLLSILATSSIGLKLDFYGGKDAT